MGSIRKKAAVVVENLPIEPSKGNVVDSVHQLLKLPADECRDVVSHLINTGQVEFQGSPKRPTALYSKVS